MWARKLLSKQEDKKVDKTRNSKTRNRNLLCGNINSARFVARTTTRIITNKQKRSGGIRRLDKRIEGIKFQTLTVMKECESVK